VDRDLIERLPCTRLVKESGHPHLLLWGAAIPVHILRCSGPIKNPKESYYELQFELLIAGYQWSIPAESRKLNVNLQWTKISLPIWMESAQGTYSDRFKVHNLLMQRVPAYSTGLDPTDMFNKTKKKELERHLPSPPHSELPLFEPGNFGLGSSMVSESYLLTIYEQLIILFPEEGIIGIVRDYLSLIYFPGLSEFYKSPDLRVCSSKPAVKFMDTGRIYIPPPPPLPPSVSPPSSSFLFSPTNACFINPFL
jgi:hypothetical protein